MKYSARQILFMEFPTSEQPDLNGRKATATTTWHCRLLREEIAGNCSLEQIITFTWVPDTKSIDICSFISLVHVAVLVFDWGGFEYWQWNMKSKKRAANALYFDVSSSRISWSCSGWVLSYCRSCWSAESNPSRRGCHRDSEISSWPRASLDPRRHFR